MDQDLTSKILRPKVRNGDACSNAQYPRCTKCTVYIYTGIVQWQQVMDSLVSAMNLSLSDDIMKSPSHRIVLVEF